MSNDSVWPEERRRAQAERLRKLHVDPEFAAAHKQRAGGQLRLSWLEGQSRRWIFDETPLAAIHPFAARVSMPPGNATVKPKGGAVAFAWYVWDHSHPIGAPAMLRRIERKPTTNTNPKGN